MRSRLRPSPAFLLAFIALCLALAAPAVAAKVLIDGKDIKNSSITSDDVKNGSLLAKDFKEGQLPAGPAGPPGKDGSPPGLADQGTVVLQVSSGTGSGSGALETVESKWIRTSPGAAAVLTLTFTRHTDVLSSSMTQRLVTGTLYSRVVLTLYRRGTTSPQSVYDLTSAKLDNVVRDGDQETWTIRPTGLYAETTYNPDGSSSRWCLNTATTEVGC